MPVHRPNGTDARELGNAPSNKPMKLTVAFGARSLSAIRSAAEIARVAKVNGGHKLGPDLRATN